jgi:hypothetical protein
MDAKKEQADLLFEAGHFEDALTGYEEAIGKASEQEAMDFDVIGHVMFKCASNASLCSLNLSDWPSALAHCKTALRCSQVRIDAGQVAKLHFRRGRACMGIGDYDQAVAAFELAQQMPGAADALRKARAEQERYNTLDPSSAAFLFRKKGFHRCLLYLNDRDVFSSADATCRSWHTFFSSEAFYEMRYKSKWQTPLKGQLGAYLSGCFVQCDRGSAAALEWKRAYVIASMCDVSQGSESYPVTINGEWRHLILSKNYLDSMKQMPSASGIAGEKMTEEELVKSGVRKIVRKLIGQPPAVFRYTPSCELRRGVDGEGGGGTEDYPPLPLPASLQLLRNKSPVLQVYRAGRTGRNGEHYAVRAVQRIQKGEFVCEYAGAMAETQFTSLRNYYDAKFEEERGEEGEEEDITSDEVMHKYEVNSYQPIPRSSPITHHRHPSPH